MGAVPAKAPVSETCNGCPLGNAARHVHRFATRPLCEIAKDRFHQHIDLSRDVVVQCHHRRGTPRLDRVNNHSPWQSAQCFGQLQRLDQPQAVRGRRGALSELRAGPGERSDQARLAGRRGRVDDDCRVVPFERLESTRARREPSA